MSRQGGAARRGQYIPPDGEVRQSQVLTTYGAGAMVDLTDQAVLVRGLDDWHYDGCRTDVDVPEARFAAALAERFRKIGRELDPQRPFRLPPPGDERSPTFRAGIQVMTFPWWFVCQNGRCRALRKGPQAGPDGRCWHDCDDGARAPMVPIRFVGACKKGHLQDYPWRDFAHRQHKGRCDAPGRLVLREGATGDFGEIIVACRSCGAREALATAMRDQGRPTCEGRQPWLGPDAREECNERLRLLVRTASNAYFSQTESALSLPSGDAQGLDQAVQRLAPRLTRVDSVDKLQALCTLDEELEQALASFDPAAVFASLQRLRTGQRPTPIPIRVAEYRTLLEQPQAAALEPVPAQDDFFARRLPRPADLSLQIERIVVAHKLREVMVQLGFTRLEPPAVRLSGEFDLEVEQARLSSEQNWLPAAEIRGEGLFVRLDEACLSEWAARPAVRAREAELARGYDAWAATLRRPPAAFPGARYYLLHSLSHMLMTAISLDCGYPASALRERLYCSEADATAPMAGILIATGSPGAEGTLGGLVGQGTRLVEHLKHAWDSALLCSSDPVCAHHLPCGDPTERYLEGAACHGCLFVAECACERFNRFLDRALVVPALGQAPELAFFAEWA
ncbi:MAG: DUF1998 domain-containing protein [Myxococcales bacterium]|nr:DUF1998 domain-containing protein [Myxococcales bacterium]